MTKSAFFLWMRANLVKQQKPAQNNRWNIRAEIWSIRNTQHGQKELQAGYIVLHALFKLK